MRKSCINLKNPRENGERKNCKIFYDMFNPKLSFFTESGFLIQDQEIKENNNGYVVLATINHNTKLPIEYDSFSDEEKILAQFFFYNQSKKSKNDYHYNTTGRIHSFGYGRMYHQVPVTKHSFVKFVTSMFQFFCNRIFHHYLHLFFIYFHLL